MRDPRSRPPSEGVYLGYANQTWFKPRRWITLPGHIHKPGIVHLTTRSTCDHPGRDTVRYFGPGFGARDWFLTGDATFGALTFAGFILKPFLHLSSRILSVDMTCRDWTLVQFLLVGTPFGLFWTNTFRYSLQTYLQYGVHSFTLQHES